MAYLDYEYSVTDTLESVARDFGVSPSEIVKINNLQQPFLLSDFLTQIKGPDGYILVPNIFDGRESFENKDRSQIQRVDVSQAAQTTRAVGKSANRIGYASYKECYIIIAGTTYYFPGYPENFSDTRTASYTNQHPLGRSEPFQIYQNSGPRTVSVTFKMHREMLYDYQYPVDPSRDETSNPIDLLVTAVQSATYPLSYNAHIPPKVILVLGKSCYIEGIIEGSVSVDWSDTIIDGRYQMVSLSFSVTEATGNPITSGEGESSFNRICGRYNATRGR